MKQNVGSMIGSVQALDANLPVLQARTRKTCSLGSFIDNHISANHSSIERFLQKEKQP
jgi:hypothetical protein